MSAHGATKRYTYSTTLSWGGDEPTAEIDVEVSYEVAWGSPESGRFGPPEHYDPGSASLVEDIRLEKVEGKPRPWNMGYGFISDDEFATDCIEKLEAHEDDMIAEAGQQDAAARDSYLEHTWKDSPVEYGGPHDGEDLDFY